MGASDALEAVANRKNFFIAPAGSRTRVVQTKA